MQLLHAVLGILGFIACVMLGLIIFDYHDTKQEQKELEKWMHRKETERQPYP